jgi:hypothetical protein
LGCEFFLGIPSFFFNIYTAIQLTRVSTVNINLKIVLVSLEFECLCHDYLQFAKSMSCFLTCNLYSLIFTKKN